MPDPPPPPPPPPRTLYYPVWIASGRRDPISFGPACASARGALTLIEERIDAGEASMGVVVAFSGGVRTPLLNYVRPERAQKVVRHWEDILTALEGRTDAD